MYGNFLGNCNSIGEDQSEMATPDRLTVSLTKDGNEGVRIEDDPAKVIRYMEVIIHSIDSYEPRGRGTR